MTAISKNIDFLNSRIPPAVRIVAVSKTISADNILEAYNCGMRCFGENRVHELLNKKDLLPPDIEWHLIGHLQRNKVKYIVPFICMIQSVDSWKLLATINSEALKISRVVDCLLQIHIAKEETKFGFSIVELEEMIGSAEFADLKNVRICGLMGMATFTSDEGQIHKEFSALAGCFISMKTGYFSSCRHFKEISMGMSGDYEIALQEGSTIIRIGSLIFGGRINTQ